MTLEQQHQIHNILYKHCHEFIPVQEITYAANEIIKNPVFANSEQNLQTSISIGKSAYNKFTNGIYGDSNSLLPIYLKKSQAERNLAGEK